MKTDYPMEKLILDACCGGRMFWKNKKHPNAVFQDIRKEVLPLKEQYGINFSVEPDVIGDFRSMSFKDKEFKMVIFDPPHLLLNKNAWMAKKYGTLKGTDYKEDIKKGFSECWRVLDDFGTLIFKWNNSSISLKEIRPLFPAEPIIFNKIGTKGKTTYWFVFMKIPKEISLWKNSVDLTPDFISRKTNKEIEQRWYKEMSNWNKLSQKHANSKDSKYRGYVTEEEHLTGERESNCEGWIEALEWVIGMSFEDAEKIEEKLK